MRNAFYALLTAASLLSACKSNIYSGGTMQITKDDVIHLDGTLEDNFIKSWEYILLDESTDALLGTINDAIRYDDGLFFIHSDMDKASTIKVFDRSGHYLNDIGRIGRARNEYLSLDSWNLDTHRNEVLIVNGDGYDGKATIKRFDYQGKFLGHIDIDSIGKEYVTVNGFAKCHSDGSLLMKDYMHSFPTHDYFILHPDGSASPLFEMSEYHQMHAPVDPALVLQQGGFKNENMNWGHEIVSGVFNLHSDTTYLTRALDNHIYRICGDSAECIAELSFIPNPPEKFKNGLGYEEETDPYSTFYFADMKDYLRVGYKDGIYLFDKSTYKLYHTNHDAINTSFPDTRILSVSDNDLIGFVDEFFISDALKLMSSPNYDHRYTPEVEDFYRKAKNCENPPIVIAHYK